VRVVAGVARGRRLVAPRGTDVRPTTDRTREAIFNALHSLGAVEGARVLDLFAGSGALGIEALSRGAASVTFVERDPGALRAVRANLASTGLDGPAATVVRADALRWLDGEPGAFDVALLDPPYAFDGWDALLARLPAPLAVVESDRAVDPGPDWRITRSKRYGSTVVTIARRAAPGASPS
jgi:16S rRNA (guanine966-N2)-methyltransferase